MFIRCLREVTSGGHLRTGNRVARVSRSAGGNRDRGGRDVGLAVPARPRPHGLHRRDGEPEGSPGAGGTILLLQKWTHDVTAWEPLADAEQEKVIGRRKADSVELDDKPADSHVASTDQDTFGHIFRRNMPYGTVTDHGTMFVGFCNEQRPLEAMPLTGAYYFVPSTDAIARATSAG
jgi:hypothetical protein